MTEICNSAKYGEIIYEESFWSGRLKITVGGKEFNKVTKKIYEYTENEVVYKVEVVGNYFIGVKLLISSSLEPGQPETVKVCDGYKWYEFVVAFLGFAFILVWGNLSADIIIYFPVIGGGIGGATGAFFGLGGLFFAGKTKVWWKRLLIALAGSVVAVLACWLLAIGYLAVMI